MQYGLPDWVSLFPPHIESIGGNDLPPEELSSGLLGWMTPELPRSRSLVYHHPQLAAWVQEQPDDSVILTNAPLIITPYTHGLVDHVAEPCYSDVLLRRPQAWLDAGACSSQYPVSIVLFQWDKYAEEAQTIQQAVERKCPDLPKRQFEQSVVYTLRRE
jgi:hypothetical protein